MDATSGPITGLPNTTSLALGAKPESVGWQHTEEQQTQLTNVSTFVLRLPNADASTLGVLDAFEVVGLDVSPWCVGSLLSGA